MSRFFRSLLLCALPLLFACPGKTSAPTCEEGCAPYQHCEKGVCACNEDYVSCDGDMSNGCEPAATCFCAYEGDESFCGRYGATCGDVAAPDNCGNRRVVDCGSCNGGLTCGAGSANVCGEGSCTPETERELCDQLDWICGPGWGSDSCGNSKLLDCGVCPAGSRCNAYHVCTRAGLPERAVCYLQGMPQGECAPDLECVGDEARAICMAVCEDSSRCTGGRQCALGYFEDGRGLCGDLRSWGESCHFEQEASDFCWDGAHPQSYLTCLSSSCQYICDVSGVGTAPCPDGFYCEEYYRDVPEMGRPTKLCMPM